MKRLRIRTVKPEFFEDEKVRSLSIQARFLLIGLITRADDRGRQQLLEPAIIGHVFPEGKVSVKRAAPWLREIVEREIVKSYGEGQDRYLWFPHFWDHQKVNRPTESEFPPHPEDPLGELGIEAALLSFRGELTEDSMSPHVHLTEDSRSPHPSRAGARSAPIPSSTKEGIQGEESLDARGVEREEGESWEGTQVAAGESWDNDRDNDRAQASPESELFAFWQEQCHHPNAKLSRERMSRIKARLRDSTSQEIHEAIEGAARGAFVNEHGQRFDDIELICRTRSKLEQFIQKLSIQPFAAKSDASARRMEWLRMEGGIAG